MAEPTNKKLYNRIKSDVKADMKWPSAYASASLQKKYKAAGGGYKGKKPKASSLSSSLSRLKNKGAPS